MPDWLLWLLPVPVTTAAAAAWVAWTSRARGPARTADSVSEHERFRRAMAAPVPPPKQPRERS